MRVWVKSYQIWWESFTGELTFVTGVFGASSSRLRLGNWRTWQFCDELFLCVMSVLDVTWRILTWHSGVYLGFPVGLHWARCWQWTNHALRGLQAMNGWHRAHRCCVATESALLTSCYTEVRWVYLWKKLKWWKVAENGGQGRDTEGFGFEFLSGFSKEKCIQMQYVVSRLYYEDTRFISRPSPSWKHLVSQSGGCSSEKELQSASNGRMWPWPLLSVLGGLAYFRGCRSPGIFLYNSL